MDNMEVYKVVIQPNNPSNVDENCLYESHDFKDGKWIVRTKLRICKNYNCMRRHKLDRPNRCPSGSKCADGFCKLLHPTIKLSN